MPPKLHFAFLGPHNSYLASVTWDVDESSKVLHHGLPKPWVDKYLKLPKNHYNSKIRGNDCFAFLGQQRNGTKKTCTDNCEKMLVEIEALRAFAKQAQNDSSELEPLLLSLGPNPGSFFAHIGSLKRYRYTNLPTELENIIQGKKYGTIHDVAMNAAGGWVIQFDEGRRYRMGGDLPPPLMNALSIGMGKKTQLRNLYLNHQNRDDFVLVFVDGSAYVGLHRGFHDDMKTLIEATFAPNAFTFLSKPFSKPKKVKINFTTSCTCTLEEQNQRNAAYYNQRGRFHLSLSRPVHALSYMTEAYRLDLENPIYKEDYFMARVAAEPFTPSAEDLIQCDTVIRHEHEFRNNKARWTEELEKRQKVLIARAHRQNPPLEWAYIEAPPQPIGGDGPSELPEFSGPYELESVNSGETWISR
ncbi:hypothetical protein FB567DRAFT_628322 [Paraphoma chrysanthemicola]|uniref:Uncharacterized protein n=1 Tax=Paraphoma chrysanthemicola TaxID=798071 RepID=A0A8K0VZB5_9PLEO|nr:hypothetical protein FB567DRAFT_628322 [Paraphoma chrysanthemicola]